MGIGRIGSVNADEIGLLQQFVHRNMRKVIGCLFLWRKALAIVVQDLHVEAAGPPRHCFANPARANQSECGMVNLGAAEEQRSPVRKFARPYITFRLGHAARRRNQQAECQVRRCVGEDARRIGDCDPKTSSGRDIDVIIANRHIGDQLQARRAGCAALQEARVDGISKKAKDIIVSRPAREQFFRRPDQPLLHIAFDFAKLFQWRICGLGNLLRDKNT